MIILRRLRHIGRRLKNKSKPSQSKRHPRYQTKWVTVLFADVEDFTALSERLPPDWVFEILDQYFSALIKIVKNHGGEVERLIGDALLATWSSSPQEAAQNACKAALEMQKELAKLQEKWLQEGKRPIKNRIGIASGEIVMGMVGPEPYAEHLLLGDCVTTATRLEALNKQHHTDILISDSTFLLLDGSFQLNTLGLQRLKGRQMPLEIFQLISYVKPLSKQTGRL
jgi:adenylate cyclase